MSRLECWLVGQKGPFQGRSIIRNGHVYELDVQFRTVSTAALQVTVNLDHNERCRRLAGPAVFPIVAGYTVSGGYRVTRLSHPSSLLPCRTQCLENSLSTSRSLKSQSDSTDICFSTRSDRETDCLLTPPNLSFQGMRKQLCLPTYSFCEMPLFSSQQLGLPAV